MSLGSHPMDPTHAAAVRDVCYHTLASLTFLIWDCVVTVDEEVKYIWTMRNVNPFKWLYFFVRYVVIFAHVMHNISTESLANGTNSPILCRLWHVYIIAMTQAVETSLVLILSARVFALYNRSRRIAFLLFVLLLAEVAGTVRILWLGQDPGFYGTCLLLRPSKNGVVQVILGFTVHCTLVGLTLFKYFFALKAGWGRTPLVSLLVRDNSTVYAAIVSSLVSVAILCRLESERAVAIFYWTTAISSIAASRMILRLECFSRNDNPIQLSPGQPLFTSEFSLTTFGSVDSDDQSTS